MRHHPDITIIGTLILLVMGFFVIYTMSLDCEGRTLIVDGTGGGEFETIQDAVNASVDGDTIRIHAGNYGEWITISTSISIIGNGTSDTIVDGGGGEAVTIMIDAENVTVMNLTVLGGGCCHGAGIKVRGDNATIIGNEITLNLLKGIHLLECSGAVIRGNRVHGNGWGVLTYRLERSVMEDNTVSGNLLGFYITESGNLTLSGNTCSGNEQTGISMTRSNNVDIVDSQIHDNFYYGLDICRSNEINIINCAILNNDEYLGIGVSFGLTGNSTVRDSIISGNNDGIRITEQGCGVIFGFPVGSIGVHNNSIHGNSNSGILLHAGTDIVINATENWWGHETGPQHSILHPGGKGDRISGGIDFYPWIGTVFLEPRITITHPTSSDHVKGIIIINGTADDPDGTVERVELSLDARDWLILNGTTSWNYTLDTTKEKLGVFEIRARSFDGEYHSAIHMISVYINSIPDNGEDPNGSNKEKEENDSEGHGLPTLLIALNTLLVILLCVLVIVVRAPDRYFHR